MGFPPSVIFDMTMWEFQCAYSGIAQSRTPDDQKGPADPMSDDQLAELGVEGFA